MGDSVRSIRQTGDCSVNESGNLYERIKAEICGEIYAGTYSEGDKLPPERLLAEKLEVSRVTVRKSLDLLQEDGLVVREVGSGTRICLPNRGNPADRDMIVLIAPGKNPFFSLFIRHFQKHAE